MRITTLVQRSEYNEFLTTLKRSFNVHLLGKDEDASPDQYVVVLELTPKHFGAPPKFNETEMQAIKDMRMTGASLREIAGRIGCNHQTVANYLKKIK